MITIDGTQLYEQAIARIRELEAEVERMRVVVEAASYYKRCNP